MKILPVSDLHLECAKDPIKLLNDLFPNEYNDVILAIAGDFYNLNKKYEYIGLLSFLHKKFHSIIIVPGNHEYYGASIFYDEYPPVNKIFKNVYMLGTDINFLDNKDCKYVDHIEIEGINFIGTTLWTDIKCFNYLDIKRAMHQVNDFHRIDYLDVDIWDQLHLNIKDKLIKKLEYLMGLDTIVITHHIPDLSLMHILFKNDFLNCAFSCKTLLKDLPEEYWPKIWIYGHTHFSAYQNLNQTLFVANPYGYPGYMENYEFNNQLFLTI
ncbi:MAG: metallophosphatase [Candidatus Woesearchaeota archaeon]|nr:MAG: metallophosphatase [Candidatus Woesearchaeota archaeon]